MFTKNPFETSLILKSQVESGPKTCQIWKLWIIGHFPFLVTFAMTFESSRWMFRMMNRPHLNMIEVSQLISPPHSPQLTAQLTFGPQMTLKCLDQLEPLPLGEIASKWNPSSCKLLIIIMWSSSQENTSSLWETLVGRIALIRVDKRSQP